ncbi:MAG: tetratricopeptide repeat protein [Anaerolineae bacterium]
MPILEDFLLNLAAGFTQTLLMHLGKRLLGDPQRRALQRAYQTGFQAMLRTAGQGLSQAELGTVAAVIGPFVSQPEVATALLACGLSGDPLDTGALAARWRAQGASAALVNIRFDFGLGLLAFQKALSTALITEASRPDSPLANLVVISRLVNLQGQVQQPYDPFQQPPASEALDEPPDDSGSPLLIPRPAEMAQLDEWFAEATADKAGYVPRLVIMTGPSSIGKHDLLQQWRSAVADRSSPPLVASTAYLPAYLAEVDQRAYYAYHSPWRQAWRQYAQTIERRLPQAVALGGIAWLALAAVIAESSQAARRYLAQMEPLPEPASADSTAVRHLLSDLLRHAMADAPLVVCIEHAHLAPATLISLLHLWQQELHNLPFFLVLTVDYPHHLHRNLLPAGRDPWLLWLRVQTSPLNAHARYLHLGPVRPRDVEAILTPASQPFTDDLCYFAAGQPAIIKDLLQHWAITGQATRQDDGRWELDADHFDSLPGTLKTRFLEEPLAACAELAQGLGYEIDEAELLDWLTYAAWEGDTFTDEALAHAVGWHGDALTIFQEILDEALVQTDANPAGVLRELDDTVALATADLEHPWRYMARYQFVPPILARVLRQQAAPAEQTRRGRAYLAALHAAYDPFLDQIAPALIQICLWLGLHQEARQFEQLIAPPEEAERHWRRLGVLRALATDPFSKQRFVSLTLEYFHALYGTVHPAPLLEYLQSALQFARDLKIWADVARLLNTIGRVYSDLGEQQRALEYYEQALPVLRQAGDRAGEAATLYNIGQVYSGLGEQQRALEYYEQALPIRQQEGDRAGEAATLTGIGIVYLAVGEPQRALEYYEQALPIQRQVGDRVGEAWTLSNIGWVYSALGEKQRALEFCEQALPMHRQVGDRQGEAGTLTSIGQVYSDLGEKQRALEFYEQALPMYRQMGHRQGEAVTLTSIGRVYSGLGEQQRALEFYEQALPMHRQVGDRQGEADTLTCIGRVYSGLGEQQRALEYYEQALPIRRQVGDRQGEAATLNNMGQVYSALGEQQRALEFYEQALPMDRQVGDRQGEAVTLTSIGHVYSGLGEPQRALGYYEQALPILRQVGDRVGEATTLTSIGHVYSALGEKQRALEFYEQALPIHRQVGDRQGEAVTLTSIGHVYSDLGEPQRALEYYELALPIHRHVGDRWGEAVTYYGMAMVYENLGDLDRVEEYLQVVVALDEAIGRPNLDSHRATLARVQALRRGDAPGS